MNSMRRGAGRVVLVVIATWLASLPSASAQELEPRAYRPLPIGLHFGLLVYTFSDGNVVVDPTTPVAGIDLDVSTLGAGLTVTAPTGNCRPERAINAGANRWGFKPEIGTTIKRGRLTCRAGRKRPESLWSIC